VSTSVAVSYKSGAYVLKDGVCFGAPSAGKQQILRLAEPLK
jgi:hypothetical protein